MARVNVSILANAGAAIKEFLSFGKAGRGAFDSISAGSVAAGNLLATGIGAAMRGVTNSIGGMVSAGSQWIELSNIQEDAQNRLATALASSGQLTASNTSLLSLMSSELQGATTVNDEVSQGLAALAINMGATAEQAASIVPTAADMSAALGISLESAVTNATKTLGGLAGELGELSPKIKNLTAEQLMAGQGLDLLSTQFAGQAAAASTTFSGALEKLGGDVVNVQERFGDVLKIVGKPMVDAFGVLVGEFDAWFAASKPEIINQVTRAFSFLAESVVVVTKAGTGLFNVYAEVRVAFANILITAENYIRKSIAMVRIQEILTHSGNTLSDALTNIVAGVGANAQAQLEYRDGVADMTAAINRSAEAIRNSLVGSLQQSTGTTRGATDETNNFTAALEKAAVAAQKTGEAAATAASQANEGMQEAAAGAQSFAESLEGISAPTFQLQMEKLALDVNSESVQKAIRDLTEVAQEVGPASTFARAAAQALSSGQDISPIVTQLAQQERIVDKFGVAGSNAPFLALLDTLQRLDRKLDREASAGDSAFRLADAIKNQPIQLFINDAVVAQSSRRGQRRGDDRRM